MDQCVRPTRLDAVVLSFLLWAAAGGVRCTADPNPTLTRALALALALTLSLTLALTLTLNPSPSTHSNQGRGRAASGAVERRLRREGAMEAEPHRQVHAGRQGARRCKRQSCGAPDVAALGVRADRGRLQAGPYHATPTCPTAPLTTYYLSTHSLL